jgi:UDP-N-acetylglucosamine acyltransferase
MALIHPTAIVEHGAKLGAGVSVGAFSTVGPEVELGDSVTVAAHVAIAGRTRIGARTRIHPFASLGQPPQHLGHKGEATALSIGTDNIIREHATMNTGTVEGGGETRIGNHCFFMVGIHVAHDCQIGNRVIMANNATLGGHVTIADDVVVGGLSAIHQFVRIGRQAMVGGMSGIGQDVIPFALAVGSRARLVGLNVVGLKRRSMAASDIAALHTAYRLVFEADGAMADRLATVTANCGDSVPAMEVVTFIQTLSGRRLLYPRRRRHGAA